MLQNGVGTLSIDQIIMHICIDEYVYYNRVLSPKLVVELVWYSNDSIDQAEIKKKQEGYDALDCSPEFYNTT